MSELKLTPKQQRFVDAWEGNGTEAARKAGYKGNDNTLCSVGKENLRKPHILKAIKAREAERRSSLIATREERQQFWSRVLRGEEVQDVVVGKGEDAEVVNIPPAMKDRLKAAELLGKSEGDFIDRQEITGAGGGPIETRQSIINDLLDSIDGATRGIPTPIPDNQDG